MENITPLFGTDAPQINSPASTPSSPLDVSPARLRRADRHQVRFDPASLDERLPRDHQARVIVQVVQRMNLSGFEADIKARGSAPGRCATDPAILVALCLYAATEGIGSSREIDQRCQSDIAYQFICGGVSMNYHTIADFRVGYEKQIDKLLTDTLVALSAKGLITVTRLAQDGTRIRACAGRSSYRRDESLRKLQKEVTAHVEELKKQSDDSSLSLREKAAAERGARERLQRIEEALALMPQAQAAKQRHTGKPSKDQPARVSTTDPQARKMKTGTGAILPAWNVQLATDPLSRAVLGVIIGNSGSDAQYAEPMRNQVERRLGGKVKEHLIDGGYNSKESLEKAHLDEVTIYMPLKKPKQGERDPGEPHRGDGPGTLAWRARMAENAAKEIYKQRASTSETVNADLVTHRGLKQFLVRGADKVKCVVLWSVLAYNLMHFGSKLIG